MKPTAGYARSGPARPAAGESKLDLQPQSRRRPAPPDEFDGKPKSSFWKWVLVVALLHLLIIMLGWFWFQLSPAKKPEEPFMSLLPPGDVVKGKPGKTESHKIGKATQAAPAPAPAPAQPAAAAPKSVQSPVAPPPPVTPPLPVPKPPISTDKLDAVPPKPIVVPPKPVPPKPKVKVDLHLVDGPASDEPKPHVEKKAVAKKSDAKEKPDRKSTPDNTGLSKEQIAEKLGDKLDPAGSRTAVKLGSSGSPSGQINRFGDFYALIQQQVHEAWKSPNKDVSIQPLVGIHVEPSGQITPGSVHLKLSSGDPVYDDAALQTVMSIGFLRERLPDGCPSNITIKFNP